MEGMPGRRERQSVDRAGGDLVRMPMMPIAAQDHNQKPLVPAKYYKTNRRAWDQRRRCDMILRLLKGVRGEVLDYGCGYGDLTYRISKTHRVEGVDVDPARVAFASQEYSPVRFRVCPADRLDCPAGSFDIVTSVVVIHFVPNPLQYLQEAHRVLRDEGKLIIACRNEPVVWNWFRRLLGKQPQTTGIAPEGLTHLLRQANFSVEAEDFYYDPPLAGWTTPGAVCIGVLELALSSLQIKATCSYYAVRAGKRRVASVATGDPV